MLLLLSRFSRVWLCVTHRWQPTRLLCPWDSPGKNTGVDCRFLLQCMKVKGESEVAQSCPTLRNPMDCSLPGSSVHGSLQARVLEWFAIAFSDWGLVLWNKKFVFLRYGTPANRHTVLTTYLFGFRGRKMTVQNHVANVIHFVRFNYILFHLFHFKWYICKHVIAHLMFTSSLHVFSRLDCCLKLLFRWQSLVEMNENVLGAPSHR